MKKSRLNVVPGAKSKQNTFVTSATGYTWQGIICRHSLNLSLLKVDFQACIARSNFVAIYPTGHLILVERDLSQMISINMCQFCSVDSAWAMLK